MRYALYKVTIEAIKFCQSGQFELKSGGANLAILINGVCTRYRYIGDIFKMQFYSNCCFTIPKLMGDGTGDAFKLSMGFNNAKSQVSWYGYVDKGVNLVDVEW